MAKEVDHERPREVVAHPEDGGGDGGSLCPCPAASERLQSPGSPGAPSRIREALEGGVRADLKDARCGDLGDIVPEQR